MNTEHYAAVEPYTALHMSVLYTLVSAADLYGGLPQEWAAFNGHSEVEQG